MPSQKEVCRRFDATPVPCSGKEILGIAIETIGKMPINGLRQNPENGTCEWYIWYGEEMSEDTEFFKPLHVSHISKYLPGVEQYLSLPPGYRFLVAGEYEDVWHVPKLTNM